MNFKFSSNGVSTQVAVRSLTIKEVKKVITPKSWVDREVILQSKTPQRRRFLLSNDRPRAVSLITPPQTLTIKWRRAQATSSRFNHRDRGSRCKFLSSRSQSLQQTMGYSGNLQQKLVYGEAGYVLEDVPHLTDYIPDLPV